MSKELIDAYDKVIREWMHLYEGIETPVVLELERKMDDLWKRMSLDEREEYLMGNKKQLETAAADFILVCDGVKNHE